jgi:hypothetical protein
MDKKLIETLFGFGALGCLVLWVLEIQRVAFKDSYWLIMGFVACVLIFQYLRYKNAEEAKTNEPLKSPANKKAPTTKSKKRK